MNDEFTIEKMIRLLLATAHRLQSYVDDGIPIYDQNLIVGEDYRIDSAERRIADYKRRIEKDKDLIKSIKNLAKRRNELRRSNSTRAPKKNKSIK